MTHIISFKTYKEKYTPDEYAKAIEAEKPYLLEIEKAVTEVEYGQLEVRITLDVRAKCVEKVQIHSAKTWLRPKAQ